MPRPIGLLVLVAAASCAHSRAVVDPAAAARATVRGVAAAMRRTDARAIAEGIDPHLARPSRAAPADRERALRSGEAQAAAQELEAAAAGSAEVMARTRLRGELDTEVVLVQTPEGWRIDPETLGLPCPTPVAAIEHLILALERLDSDPALALLTQSLRDSIAQAAAERIRGLREALPRVPERAGEQLQLQIDYGRGLFVVLRVEAGQWRIDDFN